MNKPSALYCYIPERHQKFNSKILRCFRDKCIEHLLTNPDGVRLPNKLGDIRVVGYKPQEAYVDKGATRKYKKEIYHDNSHTDGYVFRFDWNPKYSQGLKSKTGGFRNARFFKFKASAPLRQKLSRWIKDGNWTHFSTVELKKDLKS